MNVRLKKLTWKVDSNNPFWISLVGNYNIEPVISGNYANYEAWLDSVFIGGFKTLDQAQKACQKHYNEFILSQIEVENEG